MATTTIQSPHVVRPGQTLGSIGARYRQTPRQLMDLNGLDSPRIFTAQKLMVNKRRDKACSRTCVILTSKTWLRCECTQKGKPTVEVHSRGVDFNGRRLPQFNRFGRRRGPVEMARYAELPLYEDSERGARVCLNAAYAADPLAPVYDYGRPSTPTNATATGTTASAPAAAIRPWTNGAEERAKFPTPTLAGGPAPPAATRLWTNGAEERAKFPTPTLAGGPGKAAFAPMHYRSAGAVERSKFPIPIRVATPAAAQSLNLFSLYNELGLVDERAAAANARDEERAKFPEPVFTAAEIERSRFPVPML